MVSIMEIMHLCRLCLVKDQVNIPIFEDQGDIRQIFLKITACLPVKISKEDKLPKKICDGCLYKLELLYQFWNTTANAEKQLLTWIEQINMDVNTKATEEPISQPQEHTVKQEKIEPESTNDNVDLSTDAQSYILQQQQLPYQGDFPYKESQGSNADGVEASDNSEEPLSKRRRRRQATKPIPPESLDSSDNEAADSLLEMTVTKTEEESESDGDENVDDPESTKFVPTGTEDSEQPGPSGLGKGGAEAPLFEFSYVANTTENADNTCTSCGAVFYTTTSYIHHKDVNTGCTYNCNFCNKVYTTECKLSQHDSRCSMKLGTHKCQLCNRVFVWNSMLEMHMGRHKNDRKHKCSQCEKSYFTKLELLSHLAVYHNGMKFTCGICEKGFMSERYLKDHQKIHEEGYVKGIFKCTECDNEYTSRQGYRSHYRIAHGKDRVVCETCGKALTSQASYRVHMRTHNGEKPFGCKYCDKKFSSKKVLRTHERTHTREKPFVCTVCNKAFTQKSSVNVHMLTHTGKRPFPCCICPKKFKTKTLLKTHSKTHGVSLSDTC